ncbi:MAG TPA: serine--tRNA ligase [Acidimicrobiia bacterium]|nr:serine--tRNA ligase [Acidimicrobiia bacterium]
MIDLKRLRDDTEYHSGVLAKGCSNALVHEVLDAYSRTNLLRADVDGLRARSKETSRSVRDAPADERDDRRREAQQLKEDLKKSEQRLQEAETRLRELALQIPNPADESVPVGGEDANEVVRVVGEPPGAPPLDHAEFGTRIGFVETGQAAEMSGSRFAYLMNEAVLLELALVQWVMARVVAEGFTPVVPPVLVREHAMEEAGFFPTDRAQVYEVDGGELFLVGTSEVPLSALHRGEIVAAGALPLRYAGYSTCFRREAGTYGKDTRGIFRVHQFDKAEMFSFARPDRSWDELEAILALQESIVAGLGLPYRVVNCATGELGAAAAKKYDIEVWLPSEGRYRELTSCSNYLDYSARRLGTRFRADGGTQPVHTLNGTACAVGRTLVFLFEHYQRPDGSFAVPEVLIPLCGFDQVEARRP